MGHGVNFYKARPRHAPVQRWRPQPHRPRLGKREKSNASSIPNARQVRMDCAPFFSVWRGVGFGVQGQGPKLVRRSLVRRV